MNTLIKYGLVITLGIFTSVTYADDKPDLGSECERLLTEAEHVLNNAKAQGFSGTMAVTKAAGLIGAARVQQQFDKFPNCINKARRAIKYIHTVQQQHKTE